MHLLVLQISAMLFHLYRDKNLLIFPSLFIAPSITFPHPYIWLYASTFWLTRFELTGLSLWLSLITVLLTFLLFANFISFFFFLNLLLLKQKKYQTVLSNIGSHISIEHARNISLMTIIYLTSSLTYTNKGFIAIKIDKNLSHTIML